MADPGFPRRAVGAPREKPIIAVRKTKFRARQYFHRCLSVHKEVKSGHTARLQTICASVATTRCHFLVRGSSSEQVWTGFQWSPSDVTSGWGFLGLMSREWVGYPTWPFAGGRGYSMMHLMSPPGQTDTCENITFPSHPSSHSSVIRASAWSYTLNGGTIGASFEPTNACSQRKRAPWLPCWPPRGCQVLHQRWISGNMYHTIQWCR